MRQTCRTPTGETLPDSDGLAFQSAGDGHCPDGPDGSLPLCSGQRKTPLQTPSHCVRPFQEVTDDAIFVTGHPLDIEPWPGVVVLARCPANEAGRPTAARNQAPITTVRTLAVMING